MQSNWQLESAHVDFSFGTQLNSYCTQNKAIKLRKGFWNGTVTASHLPLLLNDIDKECENLGAPDL